VHWVCRFTGFPGSAAAQSKTTGSATHCRHCHCPLPQHHHLPPITTTHCHCHPLPPITTHALPPPTPTTAHALPRGTASGTATHALPLATPTPHVTRHPVGDPQPRTATRIATHDALPPIATHCLPLLRRKKAGITQLRRIPCTQPRTSHTIHQTSRITYFAITTTHTITITITHTITITDPRSRVSNI
jgi:hypothetical protein